MTRRMHHLGDLTTDEAREAVTSRPIVLVPVGAHEQHGPGMAMSTDTVRADGVAEAVAARLDGRAVIAPTIPVGVSPHHMTFPGTITLRPSTLDAVIRDVTESLYAHGWRTVVVLTGHGGNGPTLSRLAQDLLVDRPDLRFVWSPITGIVADLVRELDVSPVHGHSGEAETAQMLHLAPELVESTRLAPGATRPEDATTAALLSKRSNAPRVTVTFDEFHASGVLGDPRRATSEQGRSLIDTAADRIATFVLELIGSH